MPRCFIALNLPDQIKTEFEKIQAGLKQKNNSVKITWVKPEVAHINLHFLGDLDEKVINDLKQNLKVLEGNFGPIKLALTGVGAFPGIENPRVLFLGVKHLGENKLIGLYEKIGQILKQQKLKTEDRPFIAHITLGRIKDFNQKIKFIGEEMEDVGFEVKSFELMESVLTSECPKYKTIQSYKV